MNCKDVEPLLAPYVEDEAAPADREGVGEHLRRCPPCAAREAGERAARRLVRLRAAVLSPPAPRELRARCAALAAARRPRRLGWRAWSLAGATAAVTVFAAGLGYGVLSHSTTLLVAGLTLDHLKCFALSSADLPPADVAAVASGLDQAYGWHLAIPPGDGKRLTLVGVRRCFSSDGRVAHVMYRHDGKPLSLFVLPDHGLPPARVSLGGHAARVWSGGASTYVMVGNEADAAIQPVARYFETVLH